MQSTTTLEVAIFTVKSPESFVGIQQATHEILRSLDGFRLGTKLRSSAAPSSFADLIVWDSIGAANEASARVRHEARFQPLVQGIDRVRLYGHYTPADAGALERLGDAPVVEIAAYARRAPDAHIGEHEQVYAELRHQSGFRDGTVAQQVEDRSRFIDVIGWARAEDCSAAAGALQGMPHLAAFFAGMDVPTIFETFTHAPRTVA